MSTESATFERSTTFDDRLGDPDRLRFPEDWTLSESWQRAQQESDSGGPINDAERMVYLSGSEEPHRVTFALRGRTLVVDCDCKGHRFNDGWCSHVASLWWQWVRGEIEVNHLDTSRSYPTPPAWLTLDESIDPSEFDELTPAELDAYLTCELADVGVCEYARFTGRAHGTLTNLLRRARDTLGGGER